MVTHRATLKDASQFLRAELVNVSLEQGAVHLDNLLRWRVVHTKDHRAAAVQSRAKTAGCFCELASAIIQHTMKDNDIRGIVLQNYYDKRREGQFELSISDFQHKTRFDHIDLVRITTQLAQHGLVDFLPYENNFGQPEGGRAEINANGVDVIEGTVKPPISISFDHSHNVSVAGSSNVQIGNSNVQGIAIEIQKLITAINESNGSDEQKTEAKSHLKRFLEHPLVVSIAGGFASNIKY